MQLRYPDLTQIFDENGANTFTDTTGSYADVRFTLALSAHGLDVSLTADQTPVKYLRLRWDFTGEEQRIDQVRIYGDAWERAGGNLEWRGIVPERCMPWFMLVSNGTDRYQQRTGRLTEGFGVEVRPGAMCFWQYDSAGVTLWMDVRCGGKGVILGGRILHAARVIFHTYANCTAFEAGQQFCRAMCKDPLTASQPVYGSNNWYYAYGKSSHEEILRDARLVAELCRGNTNRPYMVIDDGWSPNPKNGPWNRGNEAFPDMACLAREISAQNVKPGIWVRYLYDQGHVCHLPNAWHMAHNPDFLDPSLPEVLNYIRQTTRRFVDWGYRLIKFDCSTQDMLGRRGYKVPYVIAEDGWSFHDRSRTSAEIILAFYRAISEAAGPDTVLIGCATITHLCAGVVHLARTGADINGMNWDITRRMGVNTLAFRMMMDKAFFAVDVDCVGITGAYPWQLTAQWLDILSCSGTPMFVSCKPDLLDAAQQDVLRRAYACNAQQKDQLIPLDWMENICPDLWLCNGQELRYSWYDRHIPVLFDGTNP